MAVAYFTIPETGKIIYNGDTVILSEYPDTIAVAAYGWYKYEDEAMNGWHFILLPSRNIVPANQVNLSLLVVVPNSPDDCRCPIPVYPIPRDVELRAFITLDNIAQRDKLTTPFVPNGRIVRVNDTGDGEPGYYQWDAASQTWLPWDISSEIPTDVIKLEIKDIITSVDSTEYTNPYVRFVFRVGEPLCSEIGVAEGTLCELYFYEVYQVITDVKTQESYIRHIYQTSPQWVAGEWFQSEIQQQIEAISKTIETWKQNDILENRLTGAPNLTEEELNALLEARLNGETI